MWAERDRLVGAQDSKKCIGGRVESMDRTTLIVLLAHSHTLPFTFLLSQLKSSCNRDLMIYKT